MVSSLIFEFFSSLTSALAEQFDKVLTLDDQATNRRNLWMKSSRLLEQPVHRFHQAVLRPSKFRRPLVLGLNAVQNFKSLKNLPLLKPSKLMIIKDEHVPGKLRP